MNTPNTSMSLESLTVHVQMSDTPHRIPPTHQCHNHHSHWLITSETRAHGEVRPAALRARFAHRLRALRTQECSCALHGGPRARWRGSVAPPGSCLLAVPTAGARTGVAAVLRRNLAGASCDVCPAQLMALRMAAASSQALESCMWWQQLAVQVQRTSILTPVPLLGQPLPRHW
jgi:hypothetical protein